MSRKDKGLALTGVPLNFLLGCSETDLGSFELARLNEVSDLRKQLHLILDRVIDQMAQAALAAWFRQTDVETLKRALENPEDVLLWAKERIRNQGRSEEELVPMRTLPPGAAHLAAALRYAERNIAKGKCSLCPKPLDRNSVRHCTKHLAMARARKPGKYPAPGSTDWLYRDGTETGRGREPSNLARLEMNREQKTRAVLAELGIPPESAAVSLKAAKEALLRVMPDSKAKAMTAYDLFQAAQIPTSIGRRSTTGYKALNELLLEAKIQRIAKGAQRGVYFLKPSPMRRKSTWRSVPPDRIVG